MPHFKALVLSATALALPLASAAQAQKVIYFDGTPPEVAGGIPDQYICVFKSGAVPGSAVAAEAASIAGQAGGSVRHTYTHALQGFSLRIGREGLARLIEKNPTIAYCEQDQWARIPEPEDGSSTTARPGGGGTKPPPQQRIDWGVQRVGGPGNGTGKTAWVIDSGVDLDHPDLRVDVARSKSFLSGVSSADDANGHGTHVAGIIGARNNSIGSVGVAADATIVSLRVLDRRGNGPDEGVLAALDHVAVNAAAGDVVNLSLVTSFMQSMNTAVATVGALGIHVVSAAGNNAADASNYSPASAGGPNVYTASAIADALDNWAFYSNFGSPVDFAEPGTSIFSLDKNGGYTTKSGTSMSAPHLAGILLLGSPNTSGTAISDPDGVPDPIGVR